MCVVVYMREVCFIILMDITDNYYIQNAHPSKPYADASFGHYFGGVLARRARPH